MKLFVVFLALNLACSLGEHPQHLFPVFRNLEALEVQGHQPNRRRLTNKFTHYGDLENIHFEFDAVPKDNHVALLGEHIGEADKSSIQDIACYNSWVEIKLHEPSDFDRIHNKLKVGHYLSGSCTNAGEKGQTHRPFYRIIKRVYKKTATRIVVYTRKAPFKELFHELSFRFVVSPKEKNPENPREERNLLPVDQFYCCHSKFLSCFGGLFGTPTTIKDGDQTYCCPELATLQNPCGPDVVEEHSSDGWWNNFITGLFDSLGDIQQYWNDLVQGTKDLIDAAINGEDGELSVALNLINLNYDDSIIGAKEKNITLINSPFLQCEECYFVLNTYVEVELSFGSLLRPESFKAEIGGSVKSKLLARVLNPNATANNGPSIVIPVVEVARFNFAIGSVPVVILINTGLDAEANSTTTFNADFGFGAEANGEARFGVEWSEQSEWTLIRDFEWENRYWLPDWAFDGSDSAIKATLFPRIILSLYDVVPIVVDAEAGLGVHFGNSAVGFPIMGSEGKFIVNDCEDPQTKYALTTFVSLGAGLGDITFPAQLLSFEIGGNEINIDMAQFGLDDIVFLPGFDFGTFDIFPERGFPESCGPLCNGCLPDYLLNKQELEDIAFPDSGNKAVEDELQKRRSARILYISLITVSSIFGAAALAFVVFRVGVRYQKNAMKGSPESPKQQELPTASPLPPSMPGTMQTTPSASFATQYQGSQMTPNSTYNPSYGSY